MTASYCRHCATTRQLDPCFKCGNLLITPHPSWDEPAIPDVAPFRKEARECGYALAEHGTKELDLDLIAVPWTDTAVEAPVLIERLCKATKAKCIGIAQKPHGRLAATLALDGWYKLVDLSITPRLPPNPQ